MTAYRGALPQDSTNFKGDYGQGDFDTRNNFVGQINLRHPGNGSPQGAYRRMAIEQHACISLPACRFTVLTDDQTDNTGGGNQRANQVIAQSVRRIARNKKPTAPTGSILTPSLTRPRERGAQRTAMPFVAPGFSDVDFSDLQEHQDRGSRINTQFRVEFYNLFNRTNYAPPLVWRKWRL